MKAEFFKAYEVIHY